MGAWFRSRVGLALIGAIIIGCIAAVAGASTLALRSSPLDGALAQGSTSATATAESAETPEATATPEATVTTTAQPTATTTPRVVPTSTPLGVGSTLRGTVVGTPGANSLTLSRNGVHYLIQVDGNTQYIGGTATKLSDIQNGWRATVDIGAFIGSNTYLASNVAASPQVDN